MQIETTVNVSDDVLFGNIFNNARLPLKWVKELSNHDDHAVIVGGGESVKDWIEEIKWRQSIGQTVFALNNAAKFLESHGIIPDHQILLDARESNISFVNHANHHYIASQCHPSLFETAENVTLWHQHYPDNMERFDASLPEYDDDYALIGGGTTVGLSALSLCYTLGYRTLHLYGYDSSYNENLHAYPQSDPQAVNCEVTVAGKKFKSTLAMAQQAELFPKMSDLLLDLGCLITIRGEGLLPWTSKNASEPIKTTFSDEATKYTAMWEVPEYSNYSPGEQVAAEFLKIVEPENDWLIADFGCGTGRGGLTIHKMGHQVVLVDFTENSRDEEAKKLPFLKWDLTKKLPIRADCGFCTDVMEHIPPDDVEKAIQNMMDTTFRCFFQICLVPDHFGQVIGQHLHLTIQPYEWWKSKFEALGYEVAWSEDCGDTALFYITFRLLGKGK
jgi:SAM-dependent methyltransferase